MMRESEKEKFNHLPLRVHSFLAGIPMHSLDCVDLRDGREAMTMPEISAVVGMSGGQIEVGIVTDALFRLRGLVGRIFRWEDAENLRAANTYLSRLTGEDRAKSLVPPGRAEGISHVLYCFENELLCEIINRTVHCFWVMASARTPNGYKLFLAVYVKKLNWFTPVYMCLSSPLLKWIVYPSMKKGIERRWKETFCAASSGGKKTKPWGKFSLTGMGFVGAAVGVALWSSASKWNSQTAQMIGKLKQSSAAGEMKTVSLKDFDRLPAPVARYFRFALKDEQPIVRTARIKHAGEFHLKNKWVPFKSTQTFSARPAGFVWDADMKLNAWMNVRVRDAYLDGQGSMLAKMFALLTAANAVGGEFLAASALQRYLAESAWQPTALLPGKHLQWTAIDGHKARATLTDGTTTVSLEFRFNDAGEIAEVFTPARFYEINGEYQSFPWAGRFWNYEERGGMMIPLQGEAEWQMPEGKLPYWRGRIEAVEYEFAR